MKIGSELIAKVTSQANAALLKIKRTLTDAFHDLKHRVSVSLKELRLLVEKSVKALKESKLFRTLKRPK
jgi:hypothetical protein